MDERTQKIIQDPKFIPSIVGLVSFVGGVGLGYILGKRRTTFTYEDIELQHDPNQMKFEFDSKVLTSDIADLKADNDILVEGPKVEEDKNVEAVSEYVVGKLKDEILSNSVKEVVTKSIFAKDDDDWDYEEEVKNRSTTTPYVLHKDEFYGDEEGYSQSTLTYYAGDGIMVDEDDTPIYNHDQITGPLLFGHGSGDPNVFHVRNHKRKAEYEIILHEGLYSVEVLGLEIEDNQRLKDLKHSGHRKFKLE